MLKAKKAKVEVLDALRAISSVAVRPARHAAIIKYSIASDSAVRSVEKLLRRTCPVSLPVKVTFRSLAAENLCGCCLIYMDKNNNLKRFEIEVDPRWPATSSVDSLIHEWAHVMDNCQNGLAKKRHRASWGVCFARAWHYYDCYGLNG
jgi:hypothetical protein